MSAENGLRQLESEAEMLLGLFNLLSGKEQRAQVYFRRAQTQIDLAQDIKKQRQLSFYIIAAKLLHFRSSNLYRNVSS